MRLFVTGMVALALLVAGCAGGEDRHERAAAECQRAAELEGVTDTRGFVTSNEGLEYDAAWFVEVTGVGLRDGKVATVVCFVSYHDEGQEWGAVPLIS